MLRPAAGNRFVRYRRNIALQYQRNDRGNQCAGGQFGPRSSGAPQVGYLRDIFMIWKALRLRGPIYCIKNFPVLSAARFLR